jgi:hypothetical protein
MRSRCQYSSVQTNKSAQQSAQQWWKVDKLPSPRKHWRNSAATRSPINLINNGWTSPEEGDWVDKHLSCMKLAISVDDQVSWTLIASSKREKMIGNNEQITDQREINIESIVMVEDQSCYRWWPSNKQWRVIVQCVTSQVTKKRAIIKMALRNKESRHEVILGESGWQRKCPALMMTQQEATRIRPIVTLAVIINDVRREDQS